VIAAWMTITSLLVLSLCAIVAAQIYRRNLRTADDCADQFIDTVESMASAGDFPPELIEHLYMIGAYVDRTTFALRVCYEFRKMQSRDVKSSSDDSPLVKIVGQLPDVQKARFMRAVALFLGSLCYRDPFNGAFMRRALLSGSRDKAIREEAVALEGMCRDFDRMAHA
jgi:hypothetical protein